MIHGTPKDLAGTLQLPALGLNELQRLMQTWRQPPFRARQVLDWLNKGVLNPDEMQNIPAELRRHMQEDLQCEPLRLVQRQSSMDGTRKYLFALRRAEASGKMVETVFIPEEKRGTVCISTQVGCVLDCPFCHTGTQQFEANLTSGEIMAQVLAVKADLRQEPPGEGVHHDVTHIVYMGMGEPLANEAGLHASLALLLGRRG